LNVAEILLRIRTHGHNGEHSQNRKRTSNRVEFHGLFLLHSERGDSPVWKISSPPRIAEIFKSLGILEQRFFNTKPNQPHKRSNWANEWCPAPAWRKRWRSLFGTTSRNNWSALPIRCLQECLLDAIQRRIRAIHQIKISIAKKVAENVNTINGIDELRTNSNPSAMQTNITFNLERDMDSAIQDVRAKLATIQAQFPHDTFPARILKYDPDSAPVLTL